MVETTPRVLFLCTQNAARSQMAEALLRHYAGNRFEVASAGLAPTSVHAFTRRVLEEKRIDTTGLHAKSLGEFLGKVDVHYAIIVCAHTEEHCPRLYPFALQTLYWPFDDPLQVQGSCAQRLEKFRVVRDQIADRLRDWLHQAALEDDASEEQEVWAGDGEEAPALVQSHAVAAPIRQQPSVMHQRWLLVRFILGLLQMLGVVISLFLLLETGVSALALGAVVLTCVCTTVSVLLFGSHRMGKKKDQQ